jgi:hypothetical protein
MFLLGVILLSLDSFYVLGKVLQQAAPKNMEDLYTTVLYNNL